MSATENLAAYLNACQESAVGGINGSFDPTLVDNVPSCAEWRINKGRYNPMWQMPAAAPSKFDHQVYSFTLTNNTFKPLKLYYAQANGWQPASMPMLQPGDSAPFGNVYLAQNYTFKVVDDKLRTVKIFRVTRDRENVVLAEDTERVPKKSEQLLPLATTFSSPSSDKGKDNTRNKWIFAFLVVFIVGLLLFFGLREWNRK